MHSTRKRRNSSVTPTMATLPPSFFHTGIFVGKLENEYITYLWEANRDASIKLYAVGSLLYLVVSINKFFTSQHLVDILIPLASMALCMAVLFVSLRTELMDRGNNAELLSAVFFTVVLSLRMLGETDTFNQRADECFVRGRDIEEIEECATLWMGFVLRQGSGFLAILLAVLWTGIIRLHFLIFMFLSELLRQVVRTFVLTPIPSGIAVDWVVWVLIVLPALLFGIAIASDNHRRRFFLLQRLLRERADKLRARLNVAEKALEFEAPTVSEIQTVNAAFDSSDTSLAGICIPFQDLELRERIGAGTFGEVVKAEYAGATVAVKRLLRNNINDEMIELMKEEVALLRQLRHPNIVPFVGVSWDSIANVCIVCEFVDRGDLSGVLHDPMIPLTWQDPQLRMMMDITSAIVFLHSRSTPVLHRDVKPDNVLVTNSFTCKLTDFGVSRTQVQDVMTGMTVVGTAHYMAPEVALGHFYTGKVDVYGLSMTLLEMHTRRPIHEGVNAVARQSRNVVLHRAVKGRRPPIPADMPSPLVDLMTSCWEQDPDDRPTAKEVLESLKSIQETLWVAGTLSGRMHSTRPTMDITTIEETIVEDNLVASHPS